METVSTTDLREHLSETLQKVGAKGERTIVTRSGKQFAALVPIEDLELLEALEDRLDADEAQRLMAEPTVPWEQVKAQLGL